MAESTAKKFFAGKQPAAVLKHELLSRYLRVYVQKTGSTSKDKRVAYIDGYAGPGTYDDGAKGSPAVAVDIAKVVTVDSDRVDGYFIEADEDSAYALSDYFEREGLEWPIYNDDVKTVLPQILDEIDPATSLFVLLDPFGLGIPMDLLGRILKRGHAPTEVVLNFSYPGLRRNAGHFTSTVSTPRYLKIRASIVDRVNATMGGDWWQQIWIAGGDDRERDILKGYLKRVREVAGDWGYWAIPVSDRWMGPPDYSLIQFTKHQDGRWHFHEALSNSLEVYRKFCFEYSGQLDFEPLLDREAEWVAEITSNVDRMLSTTNKNGFVVQTHIREVFGDALGYAREKHLKRAIKALHAQGKTATTGVGKLQKQMILPPAS